MSRRNYTSYDPKKNNNNNKNLYVCGWLGSSPRPTVSPGIS